VEGGIDQLISIDLGARSGSRIGSGEDVNVYLTHINSLLVIFFDDDDAAAAVTTCGIGPGSTPGA